MRLDIFIFFYMPRPGGLGGRRREAIKGGRVRRTMLGARRGRGDLQKFSQLLYIEAGGGGNLQDPTTVLAGPVKSARGGDGPVEEWTVLS